MDLAREHIAELERVWAQYRWNRYFLVTNANGHVHRGMNCSTCFATTQYRWLVELADCDEAEMIADYGEKACTVCFPDAPANPQFHGPGRLDREAIDARAAEKAAREARKAAKTLAPDEVFRVGRGRFGERIATVAAAKDVLRQEREFFFYYGRGPHPDYAAYAEAAQAARRVLLAREKRQAGTGATQAEIDKIFIAADRKNAKIAAEYHMSKES
jgi:hypothetical protein